ncbi:hypothetical protein Agub_g5522, partial [Astrephomene gubernaculifera]
MCSLEPASLNSLLSEWVGAWGLQAQSAEWDAAWLGLLGRAAKHDWKGYLDWSPHLAHIFAAVTALFQLPVGTSGPLAAAGGRGGGGGGRGGGGGVGAGGAEGLVGRGVPARAAGLYKEQMTQGPRHAARLIVHLLRHPPPTTTTDLTSTATATAVDATSAPTTAASSSSSSASASASAAAASAAAAAHLQHLTSLLEQYYHPSNTGKWCGSLSSFLRHLVEAACKQLERQQGGQQGQGQGGEGQGGQGQQQPQQGQQGPPQQQQHQQQPQPPQHEDSEAEDYLRVSLSGGGSSANTSAGGAAGGGAGAAAAAAPGFRPPAPPPPTASQLQEPQLAVLVGCCTTLAARGQFSKDAGLSATSISALSRLALLSPARVLPLVLSRFRTALASATAPHQLAAATSTLALCVRPLLLAWNRCCGAEGGGGGGEGAGGGGMYGGGGGSGIGMEAGGEGHFGGGGGGGLGEEEGAAALRASSAAHLLSEALMAVLPGLDANDEGKTCAVLQLYVA